MSMVSLHFALGGKHSVKFLYSEVPVISPKMFHSSLLSKHIDCLAASVCGDHT